MLEDSTICRKSSTLNCDEVKLGYYKNKELMHPLSDSSIKKYNYATFKRSCLPDLTHIITSKCS
jgi:hypothetical protein